MAVLARAQAPRTPRRGKDSPRRRAVSHPRRNRHAIPPASAVPC